MFTVVQGCEVFHDFVEVGYGVDGLVGVAGDGVGVGDGIVGCLGRKRLDLSLSLGLLV